MANGITFQDAERGRDAIKRILGSDPRFVYVGIGRERGSLHRPYVVLVGGSWPADHHEGLEIDLRQKAGVPVKVVSASSPVAQ
jgi:hypothetical protein